MTLLRAMKMAILLVAIGACRATVLEPGASSGRDGGNDGEALEAGTGASDDAAPEPDPLRPFDAATVATDPATPPWGIWSMSVQYGEVGAIVTPTIPLQAEFRPDMTAYQWICVGAPDDGTVTKRCPTIARTQCLTGTYAWTGTRWRVDFPAIASGDPCPTCSNPAPQGDITPDGQGDILIAYTGPSGSGGLFRRVGDPSSGPECMP
jgi:hypothetical protein